MSTPTANREIASTAGASRLWLQPLRSPIVVGPVALVGMIFLFYATQNWSGKRAWENCKQRLEAQGAVMDSASRSTNVIPDDLNVLKAPGMSEWFLGPTQNELMAKLNSALKKACDDAELIEITVVSRTNESALLGSDLCLDYDAPLLGLADLAKPELVAPNPPQLIPLIVMDSVPLRAAIRNLAVQEGRKYHLDSNIVWSSTQTGPGLGSDALTRFLNSFPGSKQLPEPCVSIRWENVTAFQALMSLLNNYNLVWTEDPTNHVGRISIKSQSSPIVQLTTDARAQLRQIVAKVSSLTAPNVRTLKASQGFALYHQDDPSAGSPVHPARITLRSWVLPNVSEVSSFFPGPLPRFQVSRLQVVSAGTNTFRVFADRPGFCSAEAYLAQTDCAKQEFDLMREALKRPYARLDPDNNRTLLSPLRNFVGIRVVSQTLAQRAQSHLLLGQPEQALQDLTLLHDLSAVAEAEPINLVAAMIKVAVTGLYVDAIHDGFRLGAWHEPQLLALQKQLEKIHLGPLLVDGLSSERLTICRTLENVTPIELAKAFDPSQTQGNFWEKLTSPGFCILAYGPRGWRYQSMAASANLLQSSIACFDRATQTLHVKGAEEANRATEALLQCRSPSTSLAGIVTPNFVRAWQTVSRIQTSIDLAFIACALERFRLAHGDYPPDLTSLVTGFADRLPRGIISKDQFRYRRLDNCHFKLYSLGWQGKDAGGPVPDPDSVRDYSKENWVWN